MVSEKQGLGFFRLLKILNLTECKEDLAHIVNPNSTAHHFNGCDLHSTH